MSTRHSRSPARSERWAIATFSAQHSITSGEAWTVALLGMAVAEAVGRTAVLAIRSRRIAAQAMIPATA